MKDNKGFSYKEYEIIKKDELAPDIFLFRLKGNFKFKPGQFVQIALNHYGEGTFAPCSDPANKDWFEICIRGCGNLSNQLIELLPGDFMKVRGAYGNGWPTGKMLEKNIILIAGGMGIVPIRPLIFEIFKNKSVFKKIFFIGGFKTQDHILFENDLLTWQKKFDYFKIYAERASRQFWGEKGLITEPLEKIKIEKNKTIALICGPEVMCPFCNKILLDKGLSEKDIYISFERRMECGVGLCQHCNIGKYLVCRDGPIFSLDKIKGEIGK